MCPLMKVPLFVGQDMQRDELIRLQGLWCAGVFPKHLRVTQEVPCVVFRSSATPVPKLLLA